MDLVKVGSASVESDLTSRTSKLATCCFKDEYKYSALKWAKRSRFQEPQKQQYDSLQPSSSCQFHQTSTKEGVEGVTLARLATVEIKHPAHSASQLLDKAHRACKVEERGTLRSQDVSPQRVDGRTLKEAKLVRSPCALSKIWTHQSRAQYLS